MRLYEVQYTKNDWSGDRQSVWVVASNAIRAAEYAGKKNGKYTGSSGRVTVVTETHYVVNIAK